MWNVEMWKAAQCRLVSLVMDAFDVMWTWNPFRNKAFPSVLPARHGHRECRGQERFLWSSSRATFWRCSNMKAQKATTSPPRVCALPGSSSETNRAAMKKRTHFVPDLLTQASMIPLDLSVQAHAYGRAKEEASVLTAKIGIANKSTTACTLYRGFLRGRRWSWPELRWLDDGKTAI